MQDEWAKLYGVETWKTQELDALGSSEHTVSLINIHHAQSTSNFSFAQPVLQMQSSLRSFAVTAMFADRG